MGITINNKFYVFLLGLKETNRWWEREVIIWKKRKKSVISSLWLIDIYEKAVRCLSLVEMISAVGNQQLRSVDWMVAESLNNDTLDHFVFTNQILSFPMSWCILKFYLCFSSVLVSKSILLFRFLVCYWCFTFYSVCAAKPIAAVTEFVAQLQILELLDNVYASVNFHIR